MPYASNEELPEAVRRAYSERCQTVFRRAHGAMEGDEASKMAAAHTAAKNCMRATGGEPKSMMPVKADLGEGDDLLAFLGGRRPGRVLTIPFGGPIPSKASPIGVDLDGEWFHPGTDPFVHRALRQDRERPVDWHHSLARPNDPTGVMNGRRLGKSEIDDEPGEDGWWSTLWLDFWEEAGRRRVDLMRRLAERGTQLFGSSEPLPGSVRKAGGRIDAWAHIMQTISSSPQNTLSVVHPKALLDELPPGAPLQAVRAVLSELRDLMANPEATGDASGGLKAGRELSTANEREIEEALEELAAGYEKGLSRIRGLVERVRSKYKRED